MRPRILIAITILTAMPASAATAQRLPDVKGFHFGAAVNATSIKLDETAFSDDERENGYGADLKLGYNFTRNIGVTLGITPASINDSGTSDYLVAHADIGLRALFPGRSALVPYLDLSLAGISAEYVAEGNEVELDGFGIGLGGGFNYFLSRRAALDVSFRYTTGEFDNAEIAERSVETGDGVGFNTTRLNIGIAYYP